MPSMYTGVFKLAMCIVISNAVCCGSICYVVWCGRAAEGAQSPPQHIALKVFNA